MVEKASHVPYKKIVDKSDIRHHHDFFSRLGVVFIDNTYIIVLIGFFIGRAVMLGMLYPFGVAFLISVSLQGEIKKTAAVGTSIVLGLMTTGAGTLKIQTIVCLILSLLAAWKLQFNVRTSVIKAAVVAFIASFTAALGFNFLTNGTLILEDTLIGLFNSSIVMALVYIFNYCIPVLMNTRKRSILSSEEIICMSILASIIISGFSDIYVYEVSVKVVLSVLVIAAAAYAEGPGFGTAVGTTIGIITWVSTNNVPAFTGAYAFFGLVSGIFKGLGKIGSCLGFAVASVVMHMYLGYQGEALGTWEILIGLLIFLILPRSLINKFVPFMDRHARDLIEQQSYKNRVKDVVQNRIKHVQDVLDELSNVLVEDASNLRVKHNGEVNSIINSIADKICMECDLSSICWKRDLYSTYQNMFQMIDVIQADGKIDTRTLPHGLKEKCIKTNQLIKTANYVFDIYRVNYRWRQKAVEAKKVVGDQLQGIVGILNGLSDEIGHEIHLNDDIENELAVELDKEGIDFKDIMAVQGRNGRMEVTIYRKPCFGRRTCVKDVIPIVSKVLRRRMKRDGSSCIINEGNNLCCFKLVEALKYQVSTGIARKIKDGGGLSGDNYSFIELDGGKYMMALSDGMGVGPTAAMESNSAITLLEKYLEAGFDESTALKAINSAMVLKSPDDNFATVDLCIIDLYTGEAELVKVGAASTFIKRYNGMCETIFSTTLPVGIVSNLEYETQKIQLYHGDLVVMITDGVQDAGGSSDGSWVSQALEEINSRNVQEVAEQLMKKAMERNDGEITDDMTVLVSKIWEVI